MRRLIYLPLLLLALLVAAWLVLRPALAVAVGYTAKQYCSGLLVSRLPEALLWDRDVAPRMAILGPARSLLRSGIEVQPTGVSSRLLGVSAHAALLPGRGCTLHAGDQAGTGPGPGDGGGQAPVKAGNPALGPALDGAFAEPAGGGRNTLAVLVAHRGQRVAERYLAPVTPATPLQGWSMNKSLMATWVGMQVGRGAIGLDEPVLPALQRAVGDQRFTESVSAALDLGNLLHMESGLDFRETYAPGDDATRMLYRSDAMWSVAPGRGQAHPPGEHFSYSSGDTTLAALLWQQSLGDEPYPQWLAREFSGPLGLQSLVAEADASGVQVGSSYAYMTARDWLRVGQLWLDAWHGRSALLPEGWQRDAVRPRAAADRGEYGRGFWLNTGGVAFPGLPESLFYASGNSGQAVVVLPEQELVVVRLGLTGGGVDSGLGPLLQSVFATLVQPHNTSPQAARND